MENSHRFLATNAAMLRFYTQEHVAGAAAPAYCQLFSASIVSAPNHLILSSIIISNPYTYETTKLANNMLEKCMRNARLHREYIIEFKH